MKVKVGDTTYSSKEQPLMVEFEGKDFDNIKVLDENSTKYCAYPIDKGMTPDDVSIWMQE